MNTPEIGESDEAVDLRPRSRSSTDPVGKSRLAERPSQSRAPTTHNRGLRRRLSDEEVVPPRSHNESSAKTGMRPSPSLPDKLSDLCLSKDHASPSERCKKEKSTRYNRFQRSGDMAHSPSLPASLFSFLDNTLAEASSSLPTKSANFKSSSRSRSNEHFDDDDMNVYTPRGNDRRKRMSRHYR